MKITDRKILRRRTVLGLCGISDATRYRLEAAGKFPARVRISENAVGYFSDQIEEWINSRRSDDLVDRSNLNAPDILEKRRQTIQRTRCRTAQEET